MQYNKTAEINNQELSVISTRWLFHVLGDLKNKINDRVSLTVGMKKSNTIVDNFLPQSSQRVHKVAQRLSLQNMIGLFPIGDFFQQHFIKVTTHFRCGLINKSVNFFQEGKVSINTKQLIFS